MIPAFGTGGLLPPNSNNNPYPCTAEEVRARFVEELGSPEWRVALYEGWDLLRRGVGNLVPSARWWLWGCFISSHLEPLFGEHESLQAVVFLPVFDIPKTDHEQAMLVDFLRSAHARHVDVTPLYEHAIDHPDYVEIIDAVEFKWLPRASKNIADHVERDLVPAGFVEVLP
jgi:hypothetical protein